MVQRISRKNNLQFLKNNGGEEIAKPCPSIVKNLRTIEIGSLKEGQHKRKNAVIYNGNREASSSN